MQNNLLKQSIETGELQLEFWNKVTHFEIVFWSFAFAVFVPLLLLFYQIYEPTNIKNYGVLWFSPVLIVVGVIFYFIQKNRLKLIPIKTNLSKEDFDKIIDQISKKYGWQISRNTSKEIVAKTPFSGKSWGEQVTIIFDGNNLLINSICDPDKWASVVSLGRNAQNVRLIRKRINRYSKNAGNG